MRTSTAHNVHLSTTHYVRITLTCTTCCSHQLCRYVLGGNTADASVELAYLSRLRYAGMEFGPHRWMLLDAGNGLELAFTDAVVETQSSHGANEVYFRMFRFIFAELEVIQEANRIRVSTASLQGMLDRKAPKLEEYPMNIVDFSPQPPIVRGRWLCLAQSFKNLTHARVLRTLQLSKWNSVEFSFVYRL